MKAKYFTFVLYPLILLIQVYSPANASETSQKYFQENYLSKPTGQYGVGFEDFHWINQSVCPDPNFNGKNQSDFSPDNKNYCHEIVVRIYYPVAVQNKLSTSYYKPLIQSLKKDLSQIPGIPKDQIQQLDELTSYTSEKSPIIVGTTFPVLLFSPGFGCPTQMYENFITELVSHGYIIVGINTPFINLVELPNGHVVEAAYPTFDEIEKKFVVLQSQDLIYVYNKIHILHRSSVLFSAMNLNQIGLFGHSIGARVLADIAHLHPSWFQAAATLDIGSDTTGASTKKFDIPFMHAISANRKSDSPWPITFELGNNGYLAGFAQSEDDHNYSYHMNFSDLSTLQYLPAVEGMTKYSREHVMDGFSLTLMSHDPTDADTRNFGKAAYVLIKKDNEWSLAWYNGKEKIGDSIKVNSIKDLEIALSNLPNKAPEELSDSEIDQVRQIIIARHRKTAEITGTGDGWDINDSIRTYLVKFFDNFIKYKEDPAFKDCTKLHKDTYIHCGPEFFNIR